MDSYAASSIQKKTGLILSLLSFITSILNFVSGLINFGNTPFQAFTHYTVLMTLSCSLVLFITAFGRSIFFRYFQVAIILFAGILLVMIDARGDLTSTLILLFGMVLAYQYGYFASSLYLKMIIILSVYILATFANVFLINELKLPSGIPSILFSITTVYLFWTVFSEEINSYLIRTNQLSRRLDLASSDNIKLSIISADQARLIEKKNKILEENLKEKTVIETELRRTLKVKDVLLQEVHHRVKNNLTVINGLLNLQRSDDNSDIINNFIETNSNRLYAMAAVHEAVYQNVGHESVNLTDYFSDISKNLIDIHTEHDEIKVDIQADDIELTIDIAVPLGIILNDCMSNSIVYGFKNIKTEKVISITIKEKENIEIIISDNGNRPSEYGELGDKTVSFSNWLIKLLVEDQLQGSIEMAYKNGNKWTIRIPNVKPKSAT
jgi:two-component sensor histidine kinase